MCYAPLPLLCYLGADHLTLEGGGGVGDLKKISCKRLSEEKIACNTNVLESL